MTDRVAALEKVMREFFPRYNWAAVDGALNETVGFSLTVFEMGALLHYYSRPDEWHHPHAQDELQDATRAKLRDAELIEPAERDHRFVNFVITAKGRAWVERALSTPLPVQQWVWP